MEMFYSSGLILDHSLLMLKKTKIDNIVKNIITLKPNLCLVSKCGSAAHVKNVVTSFAICASVALVPST